MILLFIVAVAFVAFANGANDNFKGVATLYGSGTLSYRRALAWATVTTFAGSACALILAGELVKRFSGHGLVADAIVADPAFLLAVAGAAAGTVLLATGFGFPISTTHALTGSLVGAGTVMAGPANVSWPTLVSAFALPLLLSPVVSLSLAAVSYLALRGVRRALDVNEETCVCIGGVPQVATYVPGAGAVRLTTGMLVTMDQLESCERRYTGTVLGFGVQAVVNKLHVLSGGTVGFARGLNDTPKIVALLIGAQALGPTAGLALVTIAMAIGGVLGARRVARTMAFGITGMNHGQGFAANLVTSLLVTLASPLGLPVSTTHVSCGALFGIGLVNREARGKTIRDIVTAWVTTLPVAASLAAAAAAVLQLAVGSR
jgi:inorganic phosphate transporter, PiT family